MTAKKGPHRFPVSVKAAILVEGKFVLLKNERDEWELAGGKLEEGEDPEECLVREVSEELSLEVRSTRILDSWLYTIRPGLSVVIVTYGCEVNGFSSLQHSGEHSGLGLFSLAELDGLIMPEGYRKSLRSWHALTTK